MTETERLLAEILAELRKLRAAFGAEALYGWGGTQRPWIKASAFEALTELALQGSPKKPKRADGVARKRK